jgi:D-3-phosphoglycerate dehydrogenase
MDTVETLVTDLLAWIGLNPRPYGEVQEVWRTSCPRLPVWEEAVDRRYVEVRFEPGRGLLVAVTPCGQARLAAHDLDRSRTERSRA